MLSARARLDFQVGEAGLARRRARLQRQARRLQAAGLRQRLDALRGSLLAHRGRLEAGSPTALLQRGYALVTVEGRTAYLRDAAAVEVEGGEGGSEEAIDGCLDRLHAARTALDHVDASSKKKS